MRRTFKIVHLLGLTLFLGSVFGHIVAGALGGEPGSPAFLAARHEISVATRALTLPGLALAILSGLGLAAAAPGLRRQRWLWLHASLAAAIVLSTSLLVVPAGTQAYALATAGAASGDIQQVLSIEHIAGAFNIVLAVIALAIGVGRPSLRLRAGSGA